jgi:hypothetical protein
MQYSVVHVIGAPWLAVLILLVVCGGILGVVFRARRSF